MACGFSAVSRSAKAPVPQPTSRIGPGAAGPDDRRSHLDRVAPVARSAARRSGGSAGCPPTRTAPAPRRRRSWSPRVDPPLREMNIEPSRGCIVRFVPRRVARTGQAGWPGWASRRRRAYRPRRSRAIRPAKPVTWQPRCLPSRTEPRGSVESTTDVLGGTMNTTTSRPGRPAGGRAADRAGGRRRPGRGRAAGVPARQDHPAHRRRHQADGGVPAGDLVARRRQRHVVPGRRDRPDRRGPGPPGPSPRRPGSRA